MERFNVLGFDQEFETEFNLANIMQKRNNLMEVLNPANMKISQTNHKLVKAIMGDITSQIIQMNNLEAVLMEKLKGTT